MLKVKIQGHIIEQHNPPLKKENNAILPDEKKPKIIAIVPKTLKIFSFLWIVFNFKNAIT